MALGFELQGLSFETTDPSEIARRSAQLNNCWRNVAREGLAIWQIILRRPEPIFSDATFASRFSSDLDRRYRARLAERQLFANRLFLVAVLRDPGFKGRMRPWGQTDTAHASPKALGDLESVAGDLEQLLRPYEPRRLSVFTRAGLVYSEFLELIGELITGEGGPAPLVAGRASAGVTTARLIFGREAMEVRQADRSRYGAMFSLKEYPATTPVGLWDGLLSLPLALNIVQSFAFLPKPAAQALLTRKQNQLVSAADPAASQVDALDEALDDLISNRFVMGEHHASVMVWADAPSVLAGSMAQTRARLAEGGLVAGRDDLGLQASFWAQCPGAFADRLRPAPVTSHNFAALAPLHTYPNGAVRDLWWTKPVSMLRSRAGSAFRFSFHVGDVGHTFICGPTGSGKTVVQNFLLSQSEALGAQRVLIDKDSGAEIFVRASNGQYLTFTPGEPSGLSPLKSLPLTAPNRAHLSALIELLLSDT
ncbi:MAG: transporter, partial [Pseudomonadota bacterium]